jgi:hypothetical protein
MFQAHPPIAHALMPWIGFSHKNPRIHVLITVHPDRIARAALGVIEILVAIGKAPFEVFESFAKQVEISPPPGDSRDLATGEGLVWFPKTSEMPIHIKTAQGSQERRRNIRNYAVGELSPEQSFYFRGPDSKLNLRAQNLQTFLQLAEGVDEATWMHHLHKGDYSAWFKSMIKDDELGRQAAEIEQTKSASAEETRRKIKEAVESRYTAPD